MQTISAPYAPEDPGALERWLTADIDALPLLAEHPRGWTLIQLEPPPRFDQLRDWRRAAVAVFQHVAQLGGQLGLARVYASGELVVATYRRLDD